MVGTQMATPRAKFDICLRLWSKISCKTFPRKTYYT